MRSRPLRLGLVVIAVVVVQMAILVHLVVLGAHPEVLWVVPVAAGLLSGAELGASVGFAAGLAIDLFVSTPFGLTALVACLVGFTCGRLAEGGMDAAGAGGLVLPGVAAVATALSVVAYPLLGAILGQQQMLHIDWVGIVVVTTVANVVLAIPVAALVRWGIGDEEPAARKAVTQGW